MRKESGFDELLSQGNCLVLVPPGIYKLAEGMVINRTSIIGVDSNYIDAVKAAANKALMQDARKSDNTW